MKLTIKSNGTIHAVNVEQKKIYDPESDLPADSDEVNSVEIDFTPSQLWSDFELWLEDDDGQKIIDYKKINLSRRNKLQMST